MPSLQLSGLASGLDWKSLVDSLMQLERAPVSRLEAERTLQGRRISALEGVRSRLQDLQSSITTLRTPALASGRSVTLASGNSTWSATASAGASTGARTIEVTSLATAARRESTRALGSPLSTSSDLSSLTVATLPTSTAVTAGSFTVNGQTISVAGTDSLQEILDRIATATSGEVQGSYDSATDRITLSGTSTLALGAANDTSNLLAALQLSHSSALTASSTAGLGRVSLQAPLANARLTEAVTAVDASGDGSFRINGVTIAYNLNTDSLATVIGRINATTAGVTADYDATTDRVRLRNSVTGDLGIHVSEASGGLMSALGLQSDSSLTRGTPARFTVDGGPERTSSSNTLDAMSHGIAGLALTVRSTGRETLTVGSDPAPLRSAIDSFIERYNNAQTFLEEQTKVTVADGKVTNSVLSGNREVQAWAQSLRSAAFAASDEPAGRLRRLEDLGIDFAAGKSLLTVKDSARLEAALRDRPAEFDALLRNSTTGFTARLDSLMKATLGNGASSGALGAQTGQINRSTAGIADQISALERRLAQRRSQLEASFIAMETAQSRLQQMQSQLTRAFGLGSTSTK